MGKLYTVNLEYGRPTVRDALHHADLSLAGAKNLGITTIKFIHGYGSSGKGGAIKDSLILFLKRKRLVGKIVEYIPGEECTPFDKRVQDHLGTHAEICRDEDYARQNYGVTFVLL